MKKPVVAFVSQPFDGVLPPRQNSIGIYIYEIAQRLSDRFDVHVITQARYRQEHPRRVGDVTYHHLTIKPDYFLSRAQEKLLGRDSLARFEHNRYRWFFALQAALAGRRIGCDLAFLFNFSQFAPVIRRFNPGIKLAVQMRCEWLNQLDERQLARNLRSLDTVIGCSEYITRRAAQRFPDATTRFMTIYNGIDTARFAYEPGIAGNGGKRILYLGRLSPEKGVHTLIDAFALAHDSDPELRLSLVGGQRQLPSRMLVDLADDPLVRNLKRFYTTASDREYVAVLRGMIGDHGLQDAVDLPGNIPYEEVVHHYRSATMLVNPSLSEAFGRGPAEASAIGLPVIASTACGLPEVVVDGETGLLVDPEQPRALADAILRLHRDPSLRRKLSVAAHARARDLFSWPAVSAEVAAYCREALAEGGS